MSDASTKVAKIAEKAPLAAGGSIRAIVPQDFESAYRMAQVVVAAGMAPKSISTVEQACVAIMHGLEVGLTPMAALQSIAVINGTPTIWGDGMLALIQNSGLLEDIEETSELDDKGEWQSSSCTMKRKHRATPIVRMFTRPMAAKAGLLGKSGPWTQYPSRMGQMRARSWCGRDGFADILRGLHNTEEVMDRGLLDVTERGHATTAPPEPRRSDFKAPVQRDDTPTEEDIEAEGWELFDEVGELVGAFQPKDWLEHLVNLALAAGTAGPKVRAQLPQNNVEAAKVVREHDGTLPAHLHLLYTPDEPAPRNWRVEGGTGEAALIKGIKELVDIAESQADVAEIFKQNDDRMQKFSAMKRDDLSRYAEARHAALAEK